jgi:hypothetical protein
VSGVGQAVFMNQRSFGPPAGQQAYTTGGTFTWVAPAGVTRVSVVAVGSGGNGTWYNGGAGGGLGYKNNITVTPGASYTVVVGAGVAGSTCQATSGGNQSYFCAISVVRGLGGGTQFPTPSGGGFTGDGGGNGGNGSGGGAGGGAGGYSGSGGGAGGSPGSGGGGGGGGNGGSFQFFCCCLFIQNINPSAGGGGVELFGQGSNGAGGTSGVFCSTLATGGGGGSSGTPGNSPASLTSAGGNGGQHGGGGGNGGWCYCQCFEYTATRAGGSSTAGAVRIIWPGCARSFPSTRTANE